MIRSSAWFVGISSSDESAVPPQVNPAVHALYCVGPWFWSDTSDDPRYPFLLGHVLMVDWGADGQVLLMEITWPCGGWQCSS